MTNKLKYYGGKLIEPRSGDAGYDLHAAEEATLFPGQQLLVRTGLHLEIPAGHVGIIKDRSSMAQRRITTRGGVIDASFRGEISVMLTNEDVKNHHVEPGDRVAQLLIVPVAIPNPVEVPLEQLSQSVRGDGAFGSTGK